MNSSATLRSHGGCAKTAQKRPYVGESDRGDGDDVNDHSHGDDDHHDHARESAHPDVHDPPHPQYAPIPVKQSTIPVSTHMFPRHSPSHSSVFPPTASSKTLCPQSQCREYQFLSPIIIHRR